MVTGGQVSFPVGRRVAVSDRPAGSSGSPPRPRLPEEGAVDLESRLEALVSKAAAVSMGMAPKGRHRAGPQTPTPGEAGI